MDLEYVVFSSMLYVDVIIVYLNLWLILFDPGGVLPMMMMMMMMIMMTRMWM